MSSELRFTSALELAALVRAKVVSPVELVEEYARCIDHLNPRLGAYLTVATDEAITVARAAERQLSRQNDLPPFHGVPIAIKDLNDTAGIRTTHGSALLASHVPTRDGAVVRRIKDAGFIVHGKTNTPEFGFSFVTEPPAYFPARNPWDLSRTPGGSSGGAGAAVAAGMTPIAQGSDAGGSIRVPAAVCGLFGIKPSRGRVSAAPYSDTLHWQNGPIARTVADAAALLDVMTGYETGDAWSARPPERPFLAEASTTPQPLRIAVSFGGVLTIGEVRDAVVSFASLLADLGHRIEEADPAESWAVLPDRDEAATDAARAGVNLSRCQILNALSEDDLDALDPVNRYLLSASTGYPASSYAVGLEQEALTARALVHFWRAHDVLLTPVVATAPIRVGEGRDGPPSDLLDIWDHFAPFTDIWNTTGQPAVSLPIGFDASGLPLGVQLVGPPDGEAMLIQLAAQAESARPWIGQRPLLADHAIPDHTPGA